MDRTISKAVAETGISADTLRYYEKIRLLPAVMRTPGGKRIYRDQDIARLRFIRRAQSVGFSLEEIRVLLRFRESPGAANEHVRELAAKKHADVKKKLQLLGSIEAELALLLEVCQKNSTTCPILLSLENEEGTLLPGQ